MTRTRHADGTTTLTIDENGRQETLLRVDPRTPDLRADAGTIERNLLPARERSEFARADTPTFESPYLNRMLAAVTAGDEAAADRVMREYAQSPEASAFRERAEPQAVRQPVAEERDVQPSPVRQA